ncbi:hypothetical protein H6F76_23370 [Leptolyngbya sp. FACHB-321]|uniref:hypothetical protein n=1 Tax=Leptolyngbya sp. FACHB-321 TaxID=2692807 RepID=UPI001683079E|nr:hypothetical protein [Leptolyngbya sp. FACHB-321]MBD2037898.1 hypothetical protein [Leptolyngbya sp. FACHB-321]
MKSFQAVYSATEQDLVLDARERDENWRRLATMPALSRRKPLSWSTSELGRAIALKLSLLPLPASALTTGVQTLAAAAQVLAVASASGASKAHVPALAPLPLLLRAKVELRQGLVWS